MVYGTFAQCDPYNLLHERNIENTRKHLYNCGGYALGTYSWYCPHDETHKGFFDHSSEETMEEQTLAHARIILKEIQNIRMINQVEEATENEEVIAFRLSETICDFHFMVRKHKRWYHKQGSYKEIKNVPTEKVFCDCWINDDGDKYTGMIVLFARKIK